MDQIPSFLEYATWNSGIKINLNTGAGSTLTSVPSKAGQMTTTGTSTSRSYAGTVDSADMVKSSGNGTALLDASLANDAGEDWDTDAAHEDAADSGALLRKQKPVMMQQQQQNFANFPMVSKVKHSKPSK